MYNANDDSPDKHIQKIEGDPSMAGSLALFVKALVSFDSTIATHR